MGTTPTTMASASRFTSVFARLFSRRGALAVTARRNFGAAAVLYNRASDPIQQVFLDKLEEYNMKAAAGEPGTLVDSTPQMQADMQAELENLQRRYGGGDLEKFPEFSFAAKAE